MNWFNSTHVIRGCPNLVLVTFCPLVVDFVTFCPLVIGILECSSSSSSSFSFFVMQLLNEAFIFFSIIDAKI